jgi:hypothetical protein
MRRSQDNPAVRSAALALPNHGRHCGCGQQAVLADPQSLHAVRHRNLDDDLDGLLSPVSAVAAHNDGATLYFVSRKGIKNALDEVREVVPAGSRARDKQTAPAGCSCRVINDTAQPTRLPAHQVVENTSVTGQAECVRPLFLRVLDRALSGALHAWQRRLHQLSLTCP